MKTEELKKKIYEVVKGIEEERIGIAFSGGIDSSLLAKVCIDVGKDVELFTVGFGKDFDINAARSAVEELGMPDFFEIVPVEEVENTLKKILPIIEYKKFAGLNTSIGFYHVLKLATERQIKFLISANGTDELFCGYNRYIELFPDEKAVNKFMDEILEIAENDKKQVQKMASTFGIKYDTPFLKKEIIEFAKTIPLEMKIKGKDDDVRKHILRKLAMDFGLSEKIAMQPKKAFQYSSGAMKAVKKLAKKNGLSLPDYIKKLKRECNA